MEKTEISHVAGTNIKWFSYCRKFDSPSKCWVTIWSRNSIPGIYSRAENIFYTKTCTWKFTEALFIRAKKWKQSKCPSTDKQNVTYPYNGMECSYKMESTDTCHSMDELQNQYAKHLKTDLFVRISK